MVKIKIQSNFKFAQSKLKFDILTTTYIYIYKEECLSVDYLFSPCNSKRHKIFCGALLDPGEVEREFSATLGVGGSWVKFHPADDKLQFSLIFQKLRGLNTILRLFNSYCFTFSRRMPVRSIEGTSVYINKHVTVCFLCI